MKAQGLASCALLAIAPVVFGQPTKGVDQPNPIEVKRTVERQHAIGRLRASQADTLQAEASLALKGTGRVLIILVEFGGADTFLFTPTGDNRSTWDPIGNRT